MRAGIEQAGIEHLRDVVGVDRAVGMARAVDVDLDHRLEPVQAT